MGISKEIKKNKEKRRPLFQEHIQDFDRDKELDRKTGEVHKW